MKSIEVVPDVGLKQRKYALKKKDKFYTDSYCNTWYKKYSKISLSLTAIFFSVILTIV